MNQYVITHENVNDRTGILLGVFWAVNPEGAMDKLQRGVLDDKVNEFEDDEGESFSLEAKVNMALWVLEAAREHDEECEVRIRPVDIDEHGDPKRFTVDDLEFVE